MTHSSNVRFECDYACRCKTVRDAILGLITSSAECPLHSDAATNRRRR